jgi:hypothetical protein
LFTTEHATESLREQYRNGSGPIRGAEFLSWVNNGSFVANPHSEDGKVFDAEEYEEDDPTLNTRPSSPVSTSDFPIPPKTRTALGVPFPDL